MYSYSIFVQQMYSYYHTHNKAAIYSKQSTSLNAKDIFKLCFGEIDDRYLSFNQYICCTNMLYEYIFALFVLDE
jgi:hypothetical protein